MEVASNGINNLEGEGYKLIILVMKVRVIHAFSVCIKQVEQVY